MNNHTVKLENREEFKKMLEHALNACNIDGYLNTPDYILAEWLVKNIESLRVLQIQDFSHYNNV